MQRFVRFMAQFPKILTKFVQKMASYSLLQMRSKRDGLNIFQIFSISTQKLMKAFLMSSIIRLEKVNLKKLYLRNLGRALYRAVYFQMFLFTVVKKFLFALLTIFWTTKVLPEALSIRISLFLSKRETGVIVVIIEASLC